MPIITGPQEVADFAERITPDVAAGIITRHAPVAPLIAAILQFGGGVERAMQRELNWYTGALVPNTTAINNVADDYDENTTSIVVDDAKVFVASDIIYAEATGEQIYVSAVNTSTNTLTVVRGFGGSTNAAGSVADNAVLRKLAHAAGEGSNVPEARSNTPSKQTTYVQHFKHSVKRSGLAIRTDTLTENELARKRRDKFEEHMRDINQAATLGLAQVTQSDADGNIVGTMGGVVPAATVNGTAIDGTMTYAEFEAAVEPALTKAGGILWGMAGPTFLSALNGIFFNKMEVRPADEAFGLTVRRVQTAHGVVNFIPDYVSLIGPLAGDSIILPLGDLMIKATRRNEGQEGSQPDAGAVLQGTNALMTPHLREMVQQPGEDAQLDVWESELAITGMDATSMATITGVTGAG